MTDHQSDVLILPQACWYQLLDDKKTRMLTQCQHVWLFAKNRCNSDYDLWSSVLKIGRPATPATWNVQISFGFPVPLFLS